MVCPPYMGAWIRAIAGGRGGGRGAELWRHEWRCRGCGGDEQSRCTWPDKAAAKWDMGEGGWLGRCRGRWVCDRGVGGGGVRSECGGGRGAAWG